MAALRYRPFRRIVAISEAVAAVLRDHDVDAGRIEVIRDAVDPDAFAGEPDFAAFRESFNIDEGTFVIASAGQLIARKGHRYLLDAAAELANSGRRFRLMLFGEGPLENELRAQATDAGLGEHVQFAGFRDDLDSYMGCFDVFVHPALAEGLGVVTLKAAASGVPVIGFEAGGVPEAVIHDETGLLVPPKDSEALRDAIAALMDNEARRKDLGASGRQRMLAEFSIGAMADKHVELYESVLNE